MKKLFASLALAAAVAPVWAASLGEDPDSVRILPTRPSASSWWGIPAAVVWRSSGAQASGTTSRLEGDLHTNT